MRLFNDIYQQRMSGHTGFQLEGSKRRVHYVSIESGDSTIITLDCQDLHE